MGTQQDVIKRFVKSLDESSKSGVAALSEAVNAASKGLYKSWDQLVTAFVTDISLYGGSGSSTTTTLDTKTNNFLKNYCGIDLDNTDTGAVTGYDAGGSSTQLNAYDIVPESSTTAKYPTESKTTYNGLTVIWPDKSKLTSKQQEIISGLYTWWFQAALDLVEESTGLSFKEDDVNSHTMTITFNDSSTSSKLASANNKNLTIYTNAWTTLDITGAENSGKRTIGSLADRIISHEMTHAVIAANVTSTLWSNDLLASCEGLAELTHGADDGRRKEIIKLAQSVNASSLQGALYCTSTSYSGYYNAYAGGYMLFRYLMKQTANVIDAPVFSGTPVIDLSKALYNGYFVIKSTKTGTAIANFQSNSASKTQTNIGRVSFGSNRKSYTSNIDLAQSISAADSSYNWSISGGSSNDTIVSGKGNNTLIGGDGKDVFIYSDGDGKDVITDYTSGEDVIRISSGNISNVSLSSSDVILTVGSGSIKIKNAKDKTLTLVNSLGKTISTVVSSSSTSTTSGGSSKSTTSSGSANSTISSGSSSSATSGSSSTSTTLTVTNSTKSPVTVSSAIRSINASTRTTAVKITGNSLANTIRGGSGADTIYGGAGKDYILGNSGNDKLYGDVGNDTLNGGAGNDTLTGGTGNDVFIYSNGDGNDVITDYTASDDTIKIDSGVISTTSLSGSDVVLKIGSGSIRVKNAKAKTLTLVNSSGKTISTVVGGNYSDAMVVNGSSNSTTLNVTDSTSSPVTAGSSVKTINATSRTTAIKITGNSLANTIMGGSSNDTIYAGSGNDYIVDNAGKNKIFGESGNDTLLGGKGNDTLSGGTGNDSLIGGTGNDSLFGSSGNDTLNGGVGNDTLTGGDGADVFIFTSGTDTITDYTSSDRISLTSGSYRQSTVGNDVRIKVGNGLLILKNAKNETINVDTSSSSKNFVEEHWFTEDDNNYELSSNTSDDLNTIFTNSSDNVIMSNDNNYEGICSDERWDRHWLDNNQVSSHGRERSNRL